MIIENYSTICLRREFRTSAAQLYKAWTDALLDMDEHFNSISRHIDPNLQARVTKTLPFSIDRVYSAWTNPKMINMWFNRDGHTLGSASADVRVGGKYAMDWQMKTGELVRLYGEYREVIPKKRLSFTWINDNHEATHISLHRQYPSLVTVDFKDLGARGTEVAIVHSHLTSEIEMADYIQGWNGCLRSMEEELVKVYRVPATS